MTEQWQELKETITEMRDCYELVKQGDWKSKTRCKLKGIDAEGSDSE